MVGRGAVAIAAGWLALAGAAVGCGKRSTQRRSGDAAPVEVVTTPALPDAGLPGATSDEVEPNDGNDVATPLPLGGTVHGKLEPDTDVDRFRLDVPAAGALAVTVTPLGELDVVLELEDASGQVIARSDRGAGRAREGVPNLPVVAGRYTAVVTAKRPTGKSQWMTLDVAVRNQRGELVAQGEAMVEFPSGISA